MKRVELEFLYLDTNVCGPCQGTERALSEAVEPAPHAGAEAVPATGAACCDPSTCCR